MSLQRHGFPVVYEKPDSAMNKQVRKTTYRGGKVGVFGEIRTEVTTIFRAVNRLHHGSDQLSLQLMPIRPLPDLLEHFLIITRGRLVSSAQIEAHFSQKIAQAV